MQFDGQSGVRSQESGEKRNALFDILADFYEHKRYGEIVIKIEAGKIVRYEKKEIVK